MIDTVYNDYNEPNLAFILCEFSLICFQTLLPSLIVCLYSFPCPVFSSFQFMFDCFEFVSVYFLSQIPHCHIIRLVLISLLRRIVDFYLLILHVVISLSSTRLKCSTKYKVSKITIYLPRPLIALILSCTQRSSPILGLEQNGPKTYWTIPECVPGCLSQMGLPYLVNMIVQAT